MPHTDDDKLFGELEDLLKKTGLSSREAAPLFKTTQTTILAWTGRDHNQRPGALPRQQLLREYALKVIPLLKKIVAAGDLPMKDDVPQKDRSQVLRAIWKKYTAQPPRQNSRASD